MKAKILFCGKWPPIQGGVTRESYNFVKAALLAGHTVKVVTNAESVEGNFRTFFLDDEDYNERDLASFGSQFELHNTTPITHSLSIPAALPSVSLLVGATVDIARLFRPDIIVGSYLEPYGVAAAIAGQLCQVPVLIRHAGSDITRLASIPELGMAYKNILCEVSGIMTVEDARVGALLDRIGFSVDRRLILKGFRFSPGSFQVKDQLNLEVVRNKSHEALGSMNIGRSVADRIIQSNRSYPLERLTSEDRGPVIGIYGKVGTTKGSYDIVKVLSALADQGLPFTFLPMCSGWPDALTRFYSDISSNSALLQRTFVVPPLAPWRVPQYLAACDAIAFLENRFSVEIHGPQVPLEILASGKTLIIAKEQKMSFLRPSVLVDQVNSIVISDPRDTESFTASLCDYVSDSQLRNYVNSNASIASKLVFGETTSLIEGNAMLKAVEGVVKNLPSSDCLAS